MPVFRYKARSPNGDATDGSIESSSTDAAAAQLIESGMTPIDIQLHIERASLIGKVNLWLAPGIGNEDLIQFCRQMHSLLRAGIPIFRAISGLTETTTNAVLKHTLREVIASLESGRTLSDSLAHHPKVFTRFFVSMVRVGETAGKLEEIFKQLSFYLDRDHATRAKIKSAIRYPSFVLAIISIALIVVSIWVIPAFNSLFSSFGADLPLPTRILMIVSEFMVAYWPPLFIVVALAGYALVSYVDTPGGRYRWDKRKLRLPLVGPVIYKASLARFSHLFSMAFEAGVPLISALTVVGNAIDNHYLEERLLGMREGVEQGNSLSRTAANSLIFDPLVLQMLTVGEESGTTGELLCEVAEYYNREVNYATERLSAAIEPILTVVIGGLILVVAMGIFLPMWDLASVALK